MTPAPNETTPPAASVTGHPELDKAADQYVTSANQLDGFPGGNFNGWMRSAFIDGAHWTASRAAKAAPPEPKAEPDRRAQIEAWASDYRARCGCDYEADARWLMAELRKAEARTIIPFKTETPIERELATVEAERDRYKNAPAVSMDAQLGLELAALRARLPTPEMVRKAARELFYWPRKNKKPLEQPTIAAIIAAALKVNMSHAAPTIPAAAVPEDAIREAAEDLKFWNANNLTPLTTQTIAAIIRRRLFPATAPETKG